MTAASPGPPTCRARKQTSHGRGRGSWAHRPAHACPACEPRTRALEQAAAAAPPRDRAYARFLPAIELYADPARFWILERFRRGLTTGGGGGGRRARTPLARDARRRVTRAVRGCAASRTRTEDLVLAAGSAARSRISSPTHLLHRSRGARGTIAIVARPCCWNENETRATSRHHDCRAWRGASRAACPVAPPLA